MGSPGRTPKLTPKVQKAIVAAIARGTSKRFAAQKAGIDERSLLRWLQAGRKKQNKVYVSFLAAFSMAEAEYASRHEVSLNKCGLGIKETTIKTTLNPDGTVLRTETTVKKVVHPAVSQWLLERRYPELYESKHKREIKEAVAAEVERLLKNGKARKRKPPADSPAS
jgi:hypothetical protein